MTTAMSLLTLVREIRGGENLGENAPEGPPTIEWSSTLYNLSKMTFKNSQDAENSNTACEECLKYILNHVIHI